MKSKKKKYNLPPGYSLLQTTFKSNQFLTNPIQFISESMELFSGTYTASLGLNRKLILTQNAEFINYVLKENHKNYHKSELATERAVSFFGRGLLFSNGDYWLKQRRLIQPAFHREKLEGLYHIVIKSIDELLQNFPAGKNIDIYPRIHRLSFTILLRSLFDIPLVPALMDELTELFTALQDFLIKDINQPLRKFIYPFTKTEKINLQKAKRVRDIFMQIITERKASGEKYNDLLDMLLHSVYEDTGEPMTDEQITDEVLVLIFAGHETTANTLSWLLYLLASDKTVQQNLFASFTDSSAAQSLDNDYLKATINEGMRLYPAAWMTERVAITDDRFKEFSFPANTIIIPFFFGLHRDKNLWREELKFVPDRFINDNKAVKSKNFFPFGAGPRMCIGNNFALAEMSFFLFSFLQKFEISPTGLIPQMRPLITLRPDKVVLNIQKRNA